MMEAKLEIQKLAVIGAGVMGSAIIQGLLSKGMLKPDQIVAADPHRERGQELVSQFGINFTEDNLEAARGSDLLILSVKPQALPKVMYALRGRVDSIKLVVSIAAGVKMRMITDGLLNSRVVRAMPNTPAQIGRGITVWTATSEVADVQRQQAGQLLAAMGEEIFVEEEKLLDMATALSGTGPAYIFMFMEALIDAGVHMGFSRREAEKLVLQTMLGSVLYAMDSGSHPAQLRNQVTSPGGTTASAMYEMEKGRMRTVVSDAVWAAYRRAVELGRDQG